MDPITSRNRSRPVGPDVYWRRRLFALAGGLTVFGLLAWAVGGASTAHPVANTSSVSTPSPPPPSTPLPSPTVSSPSPSPSSSSPKPSPSPTKTTKTTPPQAHHTVGQNAPGDDCPSGDVVVSLTANGDNYGGSTRPEFTITVVSTDAQACAFNIGPQYLTLVISSGGVRAWGSADCARGSGTKVAMLSRGVPVQDKITWNRTLSAPGCHLAGTPARPGTYTAVASDAGLHSHTVVFVLS
jgi:hypothetical protein